MLARIKFCGMTRPEDISLAADLGASYVGAVFAPSERQIDAAAARKLFASASREMKRVGVFGSLGAAEIAATAVESELDVVQLHADPTPAQVVALRAAFGGEIWAAVRLDGHRIPAPAQELFDIADAVVLDARSEKLLGGTGESLPWTELEADLTRFRRSASVVLAGGLRAENVVTAIRTLSPDIVDVASGIESAPGIKDHAKMRAFADAVSRRGQKDAR